MGYAENKDLVLRVGRHERTQRHETERDRQEAATVMLDISENIPTSEEMTRKKVRIGPRGKNYKRKRISTNRMQCAAFNCKANTGQGISLFSFPDDEERRTRWIENLKGGHDFELPEPARICANHFDDSQFVVNPQIAASGGYRQRSLRLKDDAIPTIFVHDYPVNPSAEKRKRKCTVRKAKLKRKMKEDWSSDTETEDESENSDLYNHDDDRVSKTKIKCNRVSMNLQSDAMQSDDCRDCESGQNLGQYRQKEVQYGYGSDGREIKPFLSGSYEEIEVKQEFDESGALHYNLVHGTTEYQNVTVNSQEQYEYMLKKTQNDIQHNSEANVNDCMSDDQNDVKSQSRRTIKKTRCDIDMVTRFLRSKNENRDIHMIPCEELDPLLADFILTGRKVDGGEFEATTIRSFISSIDRHFKQMNYGASIINISGENPKAFAKTRKIMKSKRKILTEKRRYGKLKRGNLFTNDEVDILYKKKIFGSSTPQSLLNTVWYINCHYFGIKSTSEHHNLRWGDIKLKTSEDGFKYLEMNKLPTKKSPCPNCKVKPIVVYQMEGERDPIKTYEIYSKNRPEDFNNPSDAFYLTPRTSVLGHNWFLRQSIGEKRISKQMRVIREAGGLRRNILTQDDNIRNQLFLKLQQRQGTSAKSDNEDESTSDTEDDEILKKKSNVNTLGHPLIIPDSLYSSLSGSNIMEQVSFIDGKLTIGRDTELHKSLLNQITQSAENQIPQTSKPETTPQINTGANVLSNVRTIPHTSYFEGVNDFPNRNIYFDTEQVKMNSKTRAQQEDNGYFLKLRNFHNKFGEALFEVQQAGMLCDVELKGKDAPVYAHRLVLFASGSSRLKSMLSDIQHWQYSCVTLNFSSFTNCVLQALVRYLYTGEIVISLKDVMSLWHLCAWLDLPETCTALKPYCSGNILTKGSVSNSLTTDYEKNQIFINDNHISPGAVQKKKISEKLNDIIQKNAELFQEVSGSQSIIDKINQQRLINKSTTSQNAITDYKVVKPDSLGHKVLPKTNNPSLTKKSSQEVFYVKNVGNEMYLNSGIAATYESNVASDDVLGNVVASNGISGNVLASDGIPGNVLVSSGISGNVLASNGISGNVLASDGISGNVLPSGFVLARNLTSNVIPGYVLAKQIVTGNAMTSNNMASNAVVRNVEASNAVTSYIVASNAVASNVVASNAVTSKTGEQSSNVMNSDTRSLLNSYIKNKNTTGTNDQNFSSGVKNLPVQGETKDPNSMTGIKREPERDYSTDQVGSEMGLLSSLKTEDGSEYQIFTNSDFQKESDNSNMQSNSALIESTMNDIPLENVVIKMEPT